MKATIVTRALLGLVMAFLLAAPVAAEEASKTPPPAESVQAQLQQQQQRILELERLLKQQMLLLERLQQQLAALPTAPPALVPSSASAAAPAVQGASQQQEVERLSGEVDALAQASQETRDKVNNLEKKAADSEKNLGAKIKGLGNFAFSGDIRVRYEPFFGGTLTQDRHRERFRLRFNALAKFSDELTGGFSLASGDTFDPTSTNQTLTAFYTRKPILIDRAFIQYDPKWFDPLTLTGGKFSYTWYRTELTFDGDLNPEGFSQALSWNFDNAVFKKITLVGFQLPFRETSSFDDSFLHGGQVQGYWKLTDRIKLATYAAFYNWHRADPILPAQGNVTVAVTGGACAVIVGCTVTPPNTFTLAGSTNTNTVAAPGKFASKFALFDLIGRLDIDTGKARWPLMLQLNFVQNTRACANLFIVTCNPHDRQGWWAEAQLGQTKEKGDINFGYTFMRIEREAVLAAFTFSDVRQPTNDVNHRINLAYQAGKNVTLGYTLLVGRALQTATSPTAEPWLKRMQFDAMYKF